MPRPFRAFYVKKRGERRTGSKQLGRAVLGFFATAAFAVGSLSLIYILFGLSLREWRANHKFVSATCQVLQTRAGRSDGSTRPEIEIQFQADDREITTWTNYDITGLYRSDPKYTQNILARFKTGQEYPCWYDPLDPRVAVLTQGYSWYAWLLLLVPASLIVAGGGGLAYVVLSWGKSTERLAATTPRAATLDLFEVQSATASKYPYVPDAEKWNDSPGTTYPFRLPLGTGEWNAVLATVLAIFWNALVGLLAAHVLTGVRRGETEWALLVLVALFLVIGIALAVFAIREVMIATGIGPTIVEISAHPLYPAGKYDLLISQAGHMAMKSLELRLVCEEVAIYRQGTNTRTTTRRVFEQVLVSRESFKIARAPFECRAELLVPREAMHSFKATHNRIDWKIVVRGTVARWPDFERAFPVVICPATEGGQA